MLENFKLAVIIKQRNETCLRRIPLHQDLQKSLADNWQDQYDSFVEEIQEVEFNAGYQTEGQECFCLMDYSLPHWLENENSQTVPSLDDFSSDETLMDSIKGIVAFTRNERSEEVVLFQNFSRSHVIRPGRFLILITKPTRPTKIRG